MPDSAGNCGRLFGESPCCQFLRATDYCRGDYMKLDDRNWHCFTVSRHERDTGKWTLEQAPVDHIID